MYWMDFNIYEDSVEVKASVTLDYCLTYLKCSLYNHLKTTAQSFKLRSTEISRDFEFRDQRLFQQAKSDSHRFGISQHIHSL